MSDLCGEYQGIERRKHCEMVVMVNQKFNDFMERYERDQAHAREYRVNSEKTMADVSVSMLGIREDIKELRRPYKVLIWVITIATGAFLVESVQWVISFMRNRISLH